MEEINNNTIRFSLMDTMEELHEQIKKVLPVVKTEWSMHQEDDEEKKPYFTTNIGRVGIEVHETYANFTLSYKNTKEEKRKYETFKQVGKIKKPLKLNMYSALVKRFREEEDYSFYKRVLRSLNGQVNIQKNNEVTFTEDADSGETNSHN
jgi:hypothetical protein